MVEKELLAAKSIFEFVIPIIIRKFNQIHTVEELLKSIPIRLNENPDDNSVNYGRYPGEEAYSFWSEDELNRIYLSMDASFIKDSLVNIRFQLIMNAATDVDLALFRDTDAITFLNTSTNNNPWRVISSHLGKLMQKSMNNLDYAIHIIGRDADFASSFSFWITQKEYNTWGSIL